MKRLLVITACLLAAGCTKEGGAYVCESDDGYVDAVAKVDIFSGKLRKYEAVDENGISFDIDERNSRSFICVTAAEHDKRQAEAQAAADRATAEQKAKCSKARENGVAFEIAYCDAMEKWGPN